MVWKAVLKKKQKKKTKKKIDRYAISEVHNFFLEFGVHTVIAVFDEDGWIFLLQSIGA